MNEQTLALGPSSGPRELITRYGRVTVPDTETDIIGRFLSRYGEWAWLEALFVSSLIPDGACVLDAGAFAGTFGLGVALASKLEFLCCVEANHDMIPFLRGNVSSNVKCKNLIIEALIADSDGRVGIGHSDPGNLGSMAYSLADRSELSGAEGAITLAGLRIEHGPFDLIKLDIEGMEHAALLGDAEFLAKGKTILWLEANEDHRTLDVARLLLSWDLELYYFAFPAFNTNNFKKNTDPIFHFAFEAGLLASPKAPPSLSVELRDAGCILKRIGCMEDLKKALWRTPRWGMEEWIGAATMQELVALAGRSMRGQSFAQFLPPGGILAPDAELTVWQPLDVAQSERAAALIDLRNERARRILVEEDLLAKTEIAEEWLRQLKTANQTISTILNSTTWRASIPLRSFFHRRPALRGLARTMRSFLGRSLRRWNRQEATNPRSVPVSLTAPISMRIRAQAVEAVSTVAPSERDAIIPYFDSEYYRATNQDVRIGAADALEHFMREGWRQGRDPSAAFDVAYYLRSNPDVAASKMNPLLHYASAGKAEGRFPRRPMDAVRVALEAAVSPRVRATDWAGGADRSAPLSLADLKAALADGGGTSGTVISVSHDDYADNLGGVQNLIADEQRAFETSGFGYLHISPAAPLPLLADPGPAADYRLHLRLNGVAIGVAKFTDLATAVRAARDGGTKLAFVFHHLLGHMPELLATLPAESDGAPVVWVHDFFTLCPSITLMRNGVQFCGAAPLGSAACSVCTTGSERPGHAARMSAFFKKIGPIVVAPSAVTLDFWRHHSDLVHTGTAVVPLARLIMSDTDRIVTTNAAPLRIAHLGGVSLHKGWPIFERLASVHADDPRYEFYHLGIGGTPSARFIRDPVRVSPDQRDAMVEAIVRHRIDVVILWSLWPETFSYVVHEALAGGAFVLARKGAGNIWPAVQNNAPKQGLAVEDEASLLRLFASGAIQDITVRAPRFRGTLHPAGNTTDIWLTGRTVTPATSEPTEIQL